MTSSINIQKKLHNKAQKELLRLDAIDTRLADRFKNDFLKCEIVYKIYLKKYIENNKSGKDAEKKNKDAQLTIRMDQVERVLKYAGFTFEKSFLEKIFGAEEHVNKRSAKVIRNELTHKMSKSALDELNNREIEIFTYMDKFLSVIRKRGI